MATTGGSRDTVWALVVFLVIVVQYVIGGWVAGYGADPAVLSHVSFAGTIVSIILALLAIVYTYYQGFAQQRDAVALASQIEALGGVANGMRASGDVLSAGLAQIRSLGDQLDRSVAIAEETRTRVGDLRASMEGLKTAASRGEPTPPSGALSEPLPRAAERLIALASPMQLAIYFGLQEAAARGMTYRTLASDIFMPISKARTSPDIQDTIAQWLDGIASGHVYLLEDLGLIARDPIVVRDLEPHFRDLLTAQVSAKGGESQPSLLLDVPAVREAFRLYPPDPPPPPSGASKTP